MGNIFTGINTKVLISENTNNSSSNATFDEVSNIAEFPVYSYSSEVQQVETYDSEYSSLNVGSIKINPINIAVYYNSNNPEHIKLDEYYKNKTEFQLKISLTDAEELERFVLLNGQISAYQTNGDKDSAVIRNYNFITTEIKNRGTFRAVPLLRGDFGIGSDGDVDYPQNTESVGNGFFKLDALNSANDIGVELLGTQTVNNGKISQVLLSDAGTTPVMRIRSNTGPLIKVYTEFEKPTAVEIGAASTEEITNASDQIKIFVSENYYNKTQTDSTFAKITYVDDSIRTVSDKVDGFDSSITEVQESVSELKSTVDGFDSSITEVQESINTINDKVNRIDNSLTEVQESVSELKGTVDGFDDSINTVKESIGELDTSKLNLTGGTLTGPLILSGDATNTLGAVTKNQMESKITELKTYSDSTFATKISVSNLQSYSDTTFATKTDVAIDLDKKLNLSGGTLTGPLILSGDATDPKGAVTKQQLDAKQSGGVPLGMSWFHDSRSYLPEGTATKDGQLLSRALFPDMWAELAAGKHPMVSDATWLADPSSRASFSSGDGSTTFRIPDWNGKSVGSLPAGVPRGDGLNSNGAVGTIQMDAFQNHAIGLSGTRNSGVFAYVGTGGTVGVNTLANNTAVTENLVIKDNGTDGVPRVAKETRMVNFTGVWVIKLAGGAMNEGQINALELATEITVLTTRVTALETKKPQFAYVYPGGSSASPGNITISQRIEVTNPFVGRKTSCRVELFSGAWGEMRDGSNIGTGSASFGVAVSYTDDKIVVVSGNQQLGSYSSLTLNGFSNNAAVATTLPYRVAVWTID
ncbi:hypothetical protein ACSJEN_002792 [Yersinia enterocolitica]